MEFECRVFGTHHIIEGTSDTVVQLMNALLGRQQASWRWRNCCPPRLFRGERSDNILVSLWLFKSARLGTYAILKGELETYGFGFVLHDVISASWL